MKHKSVELIAQVVFFFFFISATTEEIRMLLKARKMAGSATYGHVF